jgi:hypothetical protein
MVAVPLGSIPGVSDGDAGVNVSTGAGLQAHTNIQMEIYKKIRFIRLEIYSSQLNDMLQHLRMLIYPDYYKRCCTIVMFILAHTDISTQPSDNIVLKEWLCAKKFF